MGGDKPLVSVLMPYYNGKKYVSEAIESIFAQTYKNIEVIVVDDASPDKDSRDYIISLSEKYNFKLVCNECNKGISKTIATAFENSSGELIAELSQDDIFLPEKIEKQVDYLLSNRLDAVYTSCINLREPNGEMEKPQIKKIIAATERRDFDLNCIISNVSGASLQGLLVKREVVEKSLVNIWQDFMLDDWPVNVVLWTKYKTAFIDESLVLVRKHKENTSLDVWKWFAPKLEIPARLAENDEIRIEGVGRRLLSCSVQLRKKQDYKSAAIIAFAAAMLLDNRESKRKLKRALRKIPVTVRSRVAKERLDVLSSTNSSTGETLCNWDEFARKIDIIIRKGGSIEDFGEVFFQLSEGIVDVDRIRIALVGIILTGRKSAKLAQKDIDRAAVFLKSQMGLRAIFG